MEGNGEGRMRRLGPRDQSPDNGLCVTHIGHVKSNSTWVMETTSTESRTGFDQVMARCHKHLVDRQALDIEVRHMSTSVSHA
jgi:hypothetical protein